MSNYVRWRCPKRLFGIAGMLLIITVYPPLATQPLRVAYQQPAKYWPAAWIDPEVAFIELAALPIVSHSDAQQRTQAALGKRLFFDPQLAADGVTACANCHRPDQGWSINTPRAHGYQGQLGTRHPPSLYTSAWLTHLDWDGRAASIAEQALAVLTMPTEMGNPDLDSVLARINQQQRYGVTPLNATELAAALSTFLSTLEKPSRFDRFYNGDYSQLSDLEIQGLHLFRTKARCANCHFGPLLSDGRFHNLKIAFFGEPAQDLGRYAISGQLADVGAFRTASLRHIAETAPYMHHGLFTALEGVVNLYNRGGGEVWARNALEAAHPLYPAALRRSPQLRPLELTADEKAALVAFLRAL